MQPVITKLYTSKCTYSCSVQRCIYSSCYYSSLSISYYCLHVCLILVDCDDGKVRLWDGTHPSNGRVEFCLYGIWGSVCTDRFDRNDARVVCRELGYNSEGIII